MPVAWPSTMIRFGIRVGLMVLFKDSSRLGDRTKYATKVRHDVNRVV